MNTVESIYQYHLKKRSPINLHLQRLRDLAAGLNEVREFGVKTGASSSALLMGAVHVTSYDIKSTRHAYTLAEAAGSRWSYRIEDSLSASPDPCDMLFIDSDHTFRHVHAELQRHADSVGRYLVFHDTVTFGSVGAEGETGRQSWQYVVGQEVPETHLGIRHAIDLLMARDWSWRVKVAYPESHGLLVLERAR